MDAYGFLVIRTIKFLITGGGTSVTTPARTRHAVSVTFAILKSVTFTRIASP